MSSWRRIPPCASGALRLAPTRDAISGCIRGRGGRIPAAVVSASTASWARAALGGEPSASVT